MLAPTETSYIVRGVIPKKAYTYQVRPTQCTPTKSDKCRVNKALRGGTDQLFQVIAIEDKGWTLEYNRGPTTTFATSSEARQSKVLGIIMQPPDTNQSRLSGSTLFWLACLRCVASLWLSSVCATTRDARQWEVFRWGWNLIIVSQSIIIINTNKFNSGIWLNIRRRKWPGWLFWRGKTGECPEGEKFWHQ